MPIQVLGEDGREIEANLSELDAHTVAQNVHANTGETVTLVPYVLTEDGWVRDPKAARVWPASSDAKPAKRDDPGEHDIWKMTAKELDELADTYNVAGYKKSAKVDAKRKLLAKELSPASG